MNTFTKVLATIGICIIWLVLYPYIRYKAYKQPKSATYYYGCPSDIFEHDSAFEEDFGHFGDQ